MTKEFFVLETATKKIVTPEEARNNIVANIYIQGGGALVLTILAVADISYSFSNPHFFEDKYLNTILLGADGVAGIGAIYLLHEALVSASKLAPRKDKMLDLKDFQLVLSDNKV